MIVDVHTHIWQNPKQFGPKLGARLSQWLKQSGLPTEIAPPTHRAAMDQVPVSFVLGYRSEYGGAFITHEQIAACVNQFPDRVLGFAGVDPLAKDYLKDLDKIKSLNLSGVVISPSDSFFHPQNTRAMYLYEKCQALGFPVIVHQGTTMTSESNLEYARPMLFDEVARQFPNLKILVSHCGFPFVDELLALVGKHEHVYTDIAWMASRGVWQLYDVLVKAHQLEVMKKFLFGSDYPFSTPEEVISAVFQLNQFSHGSHLPAVPREKLRQMVERDALTLLGLEDTLAAKAHLNRGMTATPSKEEILDEQLDLNDSETKKKTSKANKDTRGKSDLNTDKKTEAEATDSNAKPSEVSDPGEVEDSTAETKEQ